MEKPPLDNEIHELKLGRTFDRNPVTAFHSMRYDFKPASVDTRQVSSVAVRENNSVTVSVPHIEGSGTRETVYKGNKRPSQKECVLIIDHNTGEFTLEKLHSAIQLKKTRIEGSSKIRPSTPVDQLSKPKQEVKQSPVKKPTPQSHNASQFTQNPPQFTQNPPVPPSQQPVMPSHNYTSASPPASSNSSSSESDSSDSDDEDKTHHPVNITEAVPEPKQSMGRPTYHSTLSEDLRLSESGSDSD